MAALGVASLAPAFAQGAQKPWAIGASLRGFYDDNIYTYPGTAALPRLDTFGFEASPSASYNLKRDQTTFGASYLYSMRYYIDRPRPRDDQSHQANLKLSHAFNERFSLDVKDSFVVAQEPSVLDPTVNTTLPARAEGNNVRNTGGVQLNANVFENFGVLLGYNNTIFDYEQEAQDVTNAGNPIGLGSRSAVLDRMEHLFFLDGNYQVLPKTTATLGYQYGITDFTSGDPLFILGPTLYNGAVRDSDSHFISLGVRQNVNRSLDLSAKAGVQLTSYKSPLFDDGVGPYAEASARWGYAQGSSLQAGVRHQRVPTDVRTLAGGLPAADAEATTVYLNINHAITAKISAIAMAQYQHSSYGESTPGAADAADDLIFAGLTLTYQFNPHVAAEVGYTYDRLESDLPVRGFSRNRVFVGTRLSY